MVLTMINSTEANSTTPSSYPNRGMVAVICKPNNLEKITKKP